MNGPPRPCPFRRRGDDDRPRPALPRPRNIGTLPASAPSSTFPPPIVASGRRPTRAACRFLSYRLVVLVAASFLMGLAAASVAVDVAPDFDGVVVGSPSKRFRTVRRAPSGAAPAGTPRPSASFLRRSTTTVRASDGDDGGIDEGNDGRRDLQVLDVRSYSIEIALSLRYVSDDVAERLTNGTPGDEIVYHFCDSVRKQATGSQPAKFALAQNVTLFARSDYTFPDTGCTILQTNRIYTDGDGGLGPGFASLEVLFSQIVFASVVSDSGREEAPTRDEIAGYIVRGYNRCCGGRRAFRDALRELPSGAFTFVEDLDVIEELGPPMAPPTEAPIAAPTGGPTADPSADPSVPPTGMASGVPSGAPSRPATGGPSGEPSLAPSGGPSGVPSGGPTGGPSGAPTIGPSIGPTGIPTDGPAKPPVGISKAEGRTTARPSATPTARPTVAPDPGALPGTESQQQNANANDDDDGGGLAPIVVAAIAGGAAAFAVGIIFSLYLWRRGASAADRPPPPNGADETAGFKATLGASARRPRRGRRHQGMPPPPSRAGAPMSVVRLDADAKSVEDSTLGEHTAGRKPPPPPRPSPSPAAPPPQANGRSRPAVTSILAGDSSRVSSLGCTYGTVFGLGRGDRAASVSSGLRRGPGAAGLVDLDETLDSFEEESLYTTPGGASAAEGRGKAGPAAPATEDASPMGGRRTAPQDGPLARRLRERGVAGLGLSLDYEDELFFPADANGGNEDDAATAAGRVGATTTEDAWEDDPSEAETPKAQGKCAFPETGALDGGKRTWTAADGSVRNASGEAVEVGYRRLEDGSDLGFSGADTSGEGSDLFATDRMLAAAAGGDDGERHLPPTPARGGVVQTAAPSVEGPPKVSSGQQEGGKDTWPVQRSQRSATTAPPQDPLAALCAGVVAGAAAARAADARGGQQSRSQRSASSGVITSAAAARAANTPGGGGQQEGGTNASSPTRQAQRGAPRDPLSDTPGGSRSQRSSSSTEATSYCKGWDNDSEDQRAMPMPGGNLLGGASSVLTGTTQSTPPPPPMETPPPLTPSTLASSRAEGDRRVSGAAAAAPEVRSFPPPFARTAPARGTDDKGGPTPPAGASASPAGARTTPPPPKRAQASPPYRSRPIGVVTPSPPPPPPPSNPASPDDVADGTVGAAKEDSVPAPEEFEAKSAAGVSSLGQHSAATTEVDLRKVAEAALSAGAAAELAAARQTASEAMAEEERRTPISPRRDEEDAAGEARFSPSSPPPIRRSDRKSPPARGGGDGDDDASSGTGSAAGNQNPWLFDAVAETLGPSSTSADLESLSGRSHRSARSGRSRRSGASRRSRKSATAGDERSAGSRGSSDARSISSDLHRLEVQLAMLDGASRGGGGSLHSPSPSFGSRSASSSRGSGRRSRRSGGDDDGAAAAASPSQRRPRRKRLDVVAPPGRLGVILANRTDGRGTVVSDVRGSSALHGKVLPGDRLVAIDGEDVSRKAVSQITAIMGERSDAERVLTVLSSSSKRGGGGGGQGGQQPSPGSDVTSASGTSSAAKGR